SATALGYGQVVTFTATVQPHIASAATPTGSVQFYADGTALGSPVPLSGGAASISTAAFSVGPHEVTAAYTSDTPTFTASVSLAPAAVGITAAPLVVTVNNASRLVG